LKITSISFSSLKKKQTRGIGFEIILPESVGFGAYPLSTSISRFHVGYPVGGKTNGKRGMGKSRGASNVGMFAWMLPEVPSKRVGV